MTHIQYSLAGAMEDHLQALKKSMKAILWDKELTPEQKVLEMRKLLGMRTDRL